MTWHPLILAVIALHVVGLALLGGAALKAIRLVAGWEPASASAKQLALERAAEGASVQAGAAFAAFVAAALVLVGAIATALPTLVPGAMCGTGVLAAMQGLGERALATQGIALGVFVVWRELDRLDRSRPEAPLATASARALLVTLAAQGVASWATLQALLSLDTHRPVDCCSVVYAGVGGGAAGATHAGRWLVGLVWLAGLGALVVVTLALVIRSRPRARLAIVLFAVTSAAWVVPATLALVRVLAAYRYEVLSHECPWCLFLAEHRFAGYGLFGALAVVALEAVAALTASRASAAAPATADAASRRVRAAGVRVAAATVIFAVLAGWPAVSWFARFGVWMHSDLRGPRNENDDGLVGYTTCRAEWKQRAVDEAEWEKGTASAAPPTQRGRGRERRLDGRGLQSPPPASSPSASSRTAGCPLGSSVDTANVAPANATEPHRHAPTPPAWNSTPESSEPTRRPPAFAM
jgi:hypothetical protein